MANLLAPSLFKNSGTTKLCVAADGCLYTATCMHANDTICANTCIQGFRIGSTQYLCAGTFVSSPIICGTSCLEIGTAATRGRLTDFIGGLSVQRVGATSGDAQVGIRGLDESGDWRFTIYGAAANYGFLDACWGGWDIKKTVNGSMCVYTGSSGFICAMEGGVCATSCVESPIVCATSCIVSSSRIGVGTSPTNPLHVHYAAPAYNTVDDVVRLVSKFTSTNNAASALAGSGPAIVFAGGIGDNQTRDRARIVAVYEGANVSGLAFHTQNTADIVTEQVRFHSNGHVGIGTADPNDVLDVVGSIRISSDKTNATNKTNRLRGQHYTNAEEPVAMMFVNSFASDTDMHIGGSSSIENAVTTMNFYTAANTTTTAGTQRMCIASTGIITSCGVHNVCTSLQSPILCATSCVESTCLFVCGNVARLRVHSTGENVNQSLIAIGSDLHAANTKDSWIRFYHSNAMYDKTWSLGGFGGKMGFRYQGTRATNPTAGSEILSFHAAGSAASLGGGAAESDIYTGFHSAISTAIGDVLNYSSDGATVVLDTNANANYNTMKSFRPNKSGAFRMKWSGYIQSGSYWWAWRVYNATTSTVLYSGSFNSNLDTGETNNVHAYKRYKVDVGAGKVRAGDLIELGMVSSTSGGTPVNGTGTQSLYAKEFRIYSTSPSSGIQHCNGNVGIGTDAAAYPLEVSLGNGGTVNLLRLRNADSTYSQSWDFKSDTSKDLQIVGGSSSGGVAFFTGTRGVYSDTCFKSPAVYGTTWVCSAGRMVADTCIQSPLFCSTGACGISICRDLTGGSPVKSCTQLVSHCLNNVSGSAGQSNARLYLGNTAANSYTTEWKFVNYNQVSWTECTSLVVNPNYICAYSCFRAPTVCATSCIRTAMHCVHGCSTMGSGGMPQVAGGESVTVRGYSVQYDAGGSGCRLSNAGFLNFWSGTNWSGGERRWAITNAYNMGSSTNGSLAFLVGTTNSTTPTLVNSGSLGTNTCIAMCLSRDKVLCVNGCVESPIVCATSKVEVSDGTRGAKLSVDGGGSGHRSLLILDTDSADGIGAGSDYVAIIKDGNDASFWGHAGQLFTKWCGSSCAIHCSKHHFCTCVQSPIVCATSCVKTANLCLNASGGSTLECALVFDATANGNMSSTFRMGTSWDGTVNTIFLGDSNSRTLNISDEDRVGIGHQSPRGLLHLRHTNNDCVPALITSHSGATSGSYSTEPMWSRKWLLHVTTAGDVTQNDANSKIIRLQLPASYADANGAAGTIKISYLHGHHGGIMSFEYKFGQYNGGAATSNYSTWDFGTYKVQKTGQLYKTYSYLTTAKANYIKDNIKFYRHDPASGTFDTQSSGLVIKIPNSGTSRMVDISVEIEVTGRSGNEDKIKLQDLGTWTANAPSGLTQLVPTVFWLGDNTDTTICTSSIVCSSCEIGAPAVYASGSRLGSSNLFCGATCIHADADSRARFCNVGTNAIALYADSGDELYIGSNNGANGTVRFPSAGGLDASTGVVKGPIVCGTSCITIGSLKLTGSRVATTATNLHLDALSAGTTYINYYTGTGGTVFGNGASGVVACITGAGLIKGPIVCATTCVQTTNLRGTGVTGNATPVLCVHHGAGSHTGDAIRVCGANSGRTIYTSGTLGSGCFYVTSSYNANPIVCTTGCFQAPIICATTGFYGSGANLTGFSDAHCTVRFGTGAFTGVPTICHAGGVAVGYHAACSVCAGTGQIVIGESAARCGNLTGGTIVIGSKAAFCATRSNASGYIDGVFIGADVVYEMGDYWYSPGNVIIGKKAGKCITSAQYATGLGEGVLSGWNTYGTRGRYCYTVDIGQAAGRYACPLSMCSVNVGAGASTGNYNACVVGKLNCYIGNTTVGHYSGNGMRQGHCNTFLGLCSGVNNTNGSNNIYIGVCACAGEDVNNCIVIGNGTITSGVMNASSFSFSGSVSKSAGSFKIVHPNPALKRTKTLWHSFVESPNEGDNLYRYSVDVADCRNVIELPDYYQYLNKDDMIWVSPVGHFGAAYASVTEDQKCAVVCTNADGCYNVLIIGTRKDVAARAAWKGIERDSEEAKKILV